MSASKEILTLRAMAWRRAKGELESILETYWTEYMPSGKKAENGFEEASAIIKQFIDDFEGRCR